MKKVTWILICMLLAMALALSACGGETEPADTLAVETDTPVVSDAPTGYKGAIYGGMLNRVGNDPQGFDPLLSIYSDGAKPVTSRLITLDWWKGPQGSNEWAFSNPNIHPADNVYMGDLAERWTINDPKSVTFYLREGVMWPEKRGTMDAREFIAADVVWNFATMMANPFHSLNNAASPSTIETVVATDRYTVDFTFTEMTCSLPIQGIGTQYSYIPPEVYEEHDDMSDWRNVTGTGPFMLTDYMSSSFVTYMKNPDYYLKDPEGNSLPYIDGFTLLSIPDVDTLLTALRSGQVDIVGGFNSVGYRNAEEVMETNPELHYLPKASSIGYYMLLDMKAAPFGPNGDEDAFKIRKAAFMAIDRQGMVEDYYEGNAKIITSNMSPELGLSQLALENLPESSQELFTYNPERSRELLAEAGYPDGINVTLTVGWEEEVFDLIQAYWNAAGLITEIRTIDPSTVYEILNTFTMYDALFIAYPTNVESGWRHAVIEGVMSPGNGSSIDDPVINVIIAEIIADSLRGECETAKGEQQRIDVQLALIAGAYELELPLPLTYNFWQPWIKGYSGEESVGMTDPMGTNAYIWIDDSFR